MISAQPGASPDRAPDPIQVVGFAGSLRLGSYNLALLRAAASVAPKGLTVHTLDVSEVPVFNVDLERDPPTAVSDFLDAIRSADGVLIATPEYNAGPSGVTKNLIDWASRPSGHAVLARKPVAIMGATRGSWGTVRAQAQLRQTLSYIGAYDMKKPEVLVPRAAAKFDEDGALIDDDVRERLRIFMETFARWVVRMTAPDS
jgi:chromate reductase